MPITLVALGPLETTEDKSSMGLDCQGGWCGWIGSCRKGTHGLRALQRGDKSLLLP